MADNDNLRNIEEISEEECAAGEGETGRSVISVISEFAEDYRDNLVNPDPEKCISPKALYITLGASVLGAVLVFLFIGWLLCYCPLKTTGISAEDFINEFNSIVSDADVTQMIDANVANLSGTVSPSDLKVLYPDFSDLTIPEDANLRKGVPLCGGDIILKAKIRGGDIQYLEVAVAEDCEKYDFERGGFPIVPDAHADYSTFQHYAAVGKARIAMYNLICRANGEETDSYVLDDAINYGVVMENFAYYVYVNYGQYDPSLVYSEDYETCFMGFDSSCFKFYADTIQKTVVQPDNGLYRFFDGIFGEKEPEAELPEDTAPETAQPETVTSDSGVTASQTDAQ